MTDAQAAPEMPDAQAAPEMTDAQVIEQLDRFAAPADAGRREYVVVHSAEGMTTEYAEAIGAPVAEEPAADSPRPEFGSAFDRAFRRNMCVLIDAESPNHARAKLARDSLLYRHTVRRAFALVDNVARGSGTDLSINGGERLERVSEAEREFSGTTTGKFSIYPVGATSSGRLTKAAKPHA